MDAMTSQIIQFSGQGTESESTTMQGGVGKALATMVPSDVSHTYLNAISEDAFQAALVSLDDPTWGMGKEQKCGSPVCLVLLFINPSVPLPASERSTCVRYPAPPLEQLARGTEAQEST